MVNRIQLGDISVDVVRKDIKNIHLSVHPPSGRVRISAPERMKLDTIRVFAISKLGWITRQRKKLQDQERETRREYVERESHFVWGRRYLLEIVEGSARIELTNNKIILYTRSTVDTQAKEDALNRWYRQQVKEVIPALLKKWEPVIGVKVEHFFVQRMKTKWGSCNSKRGTVRVNSELAKKPYSCLEYILVHEMVHLLERRHNERFIRLMDTFMPRWQFHRDELNRLPLRHENWAY